MIALLRRWFPKRESPQADQAPESAPRYRYTFTGFDPDLRDRTQAKRQEAERLRKQAAGVDSQPKVDPQKPRLVIGERRWNE